jgi:hypothetical protein
MKRRMTILTGLLLMFSVVGFGQQLARRSQFINNTYLLNPAVAGTKVYSPIYASYRNQWTGFDSAPVTYFLNGHTQLPNKIGDSKRQVPTVLTSTTKMQYLSD